MDPSHIFSAKRYKSIALEISRIFLFLTLISPYILCYFFCKIRVRTYPLIQIHAFYLDHKSAPFVIQHLILAIFIFYSFISPIFLLLKLIVFSSFQKNIIVFNSSSIFNSFNSTIIARKFKFFSFFGFFL